MSENDVTFMEESVSLARKCTPKDPRVNPYVGAVAVRDGTRLAGAFREEGGVGSGKHAEYILLEEKLKDEPLAGCTVYSTLEPCSKRGVGKTPCAERLVERKVAMVFIGMLDPNPNIKGNGVGILRNGGVHVQLYPDKQQDELEELNREFRRYQASIGIARSADADFIQKHAKRGLDEWYRVINTIFWNQNYRRDAASLFTHLVEVVGGLSLLASDKKKQSVHPEEYFAKAVAWWMALCGKLGVRSVEGMLWDKFPRVCPYCMLPLHNANSCDEVKKAAKGPDWVQLEAAGKRTEKPKSLAEWQQMFCDIYPPSQFEDYGAIFGRLSEELGELAEAVRVFKAEPGYFLSEASDVFAWLMHLHNLHESKAGTAAPRRGEALARMLCKTYPDFCPDCGQPVCSCPPILQATVGRIAKEVPAAKVTFNGEGRFMTPDRVSRLFGGW